MIMDKAENEQNRRWLAAWRSASEVLDRLRIEAIRQSDTATAIEQLSDAFESARHHSPPATTSGLVEQQRLFSRCRS
jgi:hypothetical protein